MATKPPSAIQVLMEDHDYVKKAYRAFQKLDPEEDLEEVQALVKNVCAALKDKDLLEEAEVEHASAKALDPKYAATFTVLCEYVDHHVKEEENEMFPKVRRARMNLQALGKKMMQAKIRLAR